MQTTANFLQLDQMTTIAPIKHFKKHVGAHFDNKLDKLFSFSVCFLSFVWLSNFRENSLLNFLLEYVYKLNKKQKGITENWNDCMDIQNDDEYSKSPSRIPQPKERKARVIQGQG